MAELRAHTPPDVAAVIAAGSTWERVDPEGLVRMARAYQADFDRETAAAKAEAPWALAAQARRKARHDPSWTDAAARAFFGKYVVRRQIPYACWVAYLALVYELPPPSCLSEEGRRQLGLAFSHVTLAHLRALREAARLYRRARKTT